MSGGSGVALSLLTGGLKAASAASSIQGARVNRERLRDRRVQERIKATEESIQRIDNLSKVLSANTARAAARGISLTSPSFRAIQANDYNAFNEDEKAASLTSEFKEREISNKIEGVTRASRATLINLAGESAQQGFSLQSSPSLLTPKTK